MSKQKNSLGFIFPGEFHEIKKGIEYIFDKEFTRTCHTSFNFQQCSKNYKVGPLFKNEKKLGALVSKIDMTNIKRA